MSDWLFVVVGEVVILPVREYGGGEAGTQPVSGMAYGGSESRQRERWYLVKCA